MLKRTPLRVQISNSGCRNAKHKARRMNCKGIPLHICVEFELDRCLESQEKVEGLTRGNEKWCRYLWWKVRQESGFELSIGVRKRKGM